MDQEKIIAAIHLYREFQRHQREARVMESKLKIVVEQMTEQECGQYIKAISIINSVNP